MKIALVGSAPSSILLAPYDDPEWTIWGCSPGAYPHLRRLDAFFEIHRWRPGVNGFSPQYIEWMAALQCPVYTLEKQPDIPASVVYPVDAILAQYPGLARSFFTSSLAWMLALAIDVIEAERKRTKKTGEHEIGFWGVDMAANDEYHFQKPGCHFFILEAERRGIRVTAPPESDLLRPVPLYGPGEASPMRVKMEVRKRELADRLQALAEHGRQLDAQFQQNVREQHFVQGALDDMQYHLNTWVD